MSARGRALATAFLLMLMSGCRAAPGIDPPLTIFASPSGSELHIRPDFTVVPYGGLRRDETGALVLGEFGRSDVETTIADCSEGSVRCALIGSTVLAFDEKAISAGETYTFGDVRFTPTCTERDPSTGACAVGVVVYADATWPRYAGVFGFDRAGVLFFSTMWGPIGQGGWATCAFAWGQRILGPDWGTPDAKLRPPKLSSEWVDAEKLLRMQ